MSIDTSGVSPLIKEKAPLILAEIQKAKSILLHCHPSPDPDSVGSALAMKFALEQMGKKATVIKGDSDIPQAFMHFPGARDIVQKSFGEVDQNDFDLFISLDSSTVDRISKACSHGFSPKFPVINIDHHRSNTKFGSLMLIVDDHPATAQVLSELFSEWNLKITREIASNLFIGIYTDTGGLQYRGVTRRTYQIMADLVELVPDFTVLIDEIENSNTPGSIAYQAAALSNIETFLGGKLAIATVPNKVIRDNNITDADMGSVQISPILRSVIGWDIDVGLVEKEPGEIKVGLRTRDADKYDVSRLAVALGGGGHKAAAGAGLTGMSLEEAKKLVVAKAKELYNL